MSKLRHLAKFSEKLHNISDEEDKKYSDFINIMLLSVLCRPITILMINCFLVSQRAVSSGCMPKSVRLKGYIYKAKEVFSRELEGLFLEPEKSNAA
jgi:hypothetical protein